MSPRRHVHKWVVAPADECEGLDHFPAKCRVRGCGEERTFPKLLEDKHGQAVAYMEPRGILPY